MFRRVSVSGIAIALCAGVVGAAPGTTPAKSSPPPTAKPSPAARPVVPNSIILKETTTLNEVLKAAQVKTGTVIQVDESAKGYAATYVFPPSVAGTKLDPKSATAVLNFITGSGWEGSKLPLEKRGSAGPNYMLAHTPYVSQRAPRYWTCNNRVWDWSKVSVPVAATTPQPASAAGGAAKTGKKPPQTAAPKMQSVVKITKRVTDDGDIVVTQPVDLGVIKDDYTLRTVLQILRVKANITVNIFGSEYAPGPGSAGAAPRLFPMTIGSIPPALKNQLNKPMTVGHLLTLLAEGLNKYTVKGNGDWKWSSSFMPPDESGNRKVVYTLRDYGNH